MMSEFSPEPDDPALHSFAAELARLQPRVALPPRDDLVFRAGWEAALAALARGEKIQALEVLPCESTTAAAPLQTALVAVSSGADIPVSRPATSADNDVRHARQQTAPAWQSGYFWPAATAVLLMICLGLVAAMNSQLPSGPGIVKQQQQPVSPPGTSKQIHNYAGNSVKSIPPLISQQESAASPTWNISRIVNHAAAWETLDQFATLLRTFAPASEDEPEPTLAPGSQNRSYLQLRERVLRAGLTTWPTEPRTFTATAATFNPLSREMWRSEIEPQR